jgi:hypothetical protein
MTGPVPPERLAENRVVLVHVAHVIRARESQRPVVVERHVAEGDGHLQVPREGRGVLRARRDLAADAESLACHGRAAREDAVGALADVLGGNARQLAAAERQGQHHPAILQPARALAGIDEVLPVERRRRALRRERCIRLALRVEVRHFVPAPERLQAGIEALLSRTQRLPRVPTCAFSDQRTSCRLTLGS